jgi:MFS family permease
VEGNVVVLNGTLTIAGEVRGDVSVSRGDLRLMEGAAVGGDAVVTAGRLVNQGATVGGEMRVVDAGRAIGAQGGRAASRARLGRSWFAPIGEGLRGLMQTLALGLVLAGVGVGMIFYGHPQLSRISDTVRGERLRSAGVGLIASFLALPAFLVGLVAIAITIIGIPLLVLYVPLYWVAAAAAAAVGLVAVAHAIGERTAEQRGSYDAVHRNAYTYLFTGLGLLLAPLVMSHLLQMTGVLGFVGDLLWVVAWIGLWLAACVGGGAVLLSAARAWREHRYRKLMGMGPADGGDAHPA